MKAKSMRRNRLVRVVAGILAVLLVALASYALWTVYENTVTPAAQAPGAIVERETVVSGRALADCGAGAQGLRR
jgi:hypothetical protein